MCGAICLVFWTVSTGMLCNCVPFHLKSRVATGFFGFQPTLEFFRSIQITFCGTPSHLQSRSGLWTLAELCTQELKH